jgi:hypothetical protein
MQRQLFKGSSAKLLEVYVNYAYDENANRIHENQKRSETLESLKRHHGPSGRLHFDNLLLKSHLGIRISQFSIRWRVLIMKTKERIADDFPDSDKI